MNITKSILATILLLTVSCGSNTTTVENKYDDSQVQAILVIQDARIKALEARINAYDSNFDLVTIEFSEKLSNLENEFKSKDELLDTNIQVINSGLAMLQGKQVTPVKICSSKEYLIKQGNDYYVVYMVSNNYGTFLGKLAENINYATTDEVKARFKVVNNELVCQ